MKIGISNWARPFASAWRVLAFTLVVCATGGAWAGLVAEWGPGEFPVSAQGAAAVTSTDGTCTLTKNNAGNISTANNLTIKGWPAVVTPSSNLSALTVVVGYKAPSATASGTIVQFGAGASGSGTKISANLVNGSLRLGWQTNYSWGDSNNAITGLNQPNDDAVHFVTLASSESNGTTIRFDGGNKVTAGGLKWGSMSIAEITLGAIRGPANVLTDVEYQYIAVYDSVLSDADALTAYQRAKKAVVCSGSVTPNVDGESNCTFTVTEDAAYNVESAATYNTVTFNVTEGKTLILSGATLTGSNGVTVNGGMVEVSSATALAGTLKGDGTLCYTTVVPSGLGCKTSAWEGTLWIRDYGTSSTSWQLDEFGSSKSTLRLTGVQGWMNYSNGTVSPTVELYGIGLTINNGNSGWKTTLNELTGSGILTVSGGSSSGNGLLIKKASGFTGSINVSSANKYTVTIGGTTCKSGNNGKLIIANGAEVNIAARKTWNAAGGIEINGTVKLASTGTITGTITGASTGVVVCNGFLPTASFTNAGWAGTLWLENQTIDAFEATSYGSGTSTIKMSDVQIYFNTSANKNTTVDYTGALDVSAKNSDGTDASYGIQIYNGWTASGDNNTWSYPMTSFATLKGDGLIKDTDNGAGPLLWFKDASAFTGSINLSYYKRLRLGSDTTACDANGRVFVTAGSTAKVANGQSWTATGGVKVFGNLAFEGTGNVSGAVITDNGTTLDFSESTSDTRISGALTLASGTTIKLPADAEFPYQIASSGDGIVDNVTVEIDGGATTTSAVKLANGAISLAKSATISGAMVQEVFSNISWTGSGDAYLLTLSADVTLLTFDDVSDVEELKIVVENNGLLYVAGELPENISVDGLTSLTVSDDETLTLAADYTRLYSQIGTTTTGNDALSSSGTTISVSYALLGAALPEGNYTIARWLTPQKLSSGYGHVATVSATVGTETDGETSLSMELVYMADRIVLRVYDATAQAARGTIKIWPYGDSITEGYNANHSGQNYRVLLYQKLALLGYNVQSVGCYNLDDGTESEDPSGQELPAAWKWHSAKHGATAGRSDTTASSRGNLEENVDTLCAQAGNPDVVLLHIGINDIVSSDRNPTTVYASISNVISRLESNLPNSIIVVSTVLDVATAAQTGRQINGVYLPTLVDQLNEKIRNGIGAFTSGRVVLADLNDYVKSADDGIIYDGVHPDWWGYDQMAEGWLAAITDNFTADDTFNDAMLPAVASSSLGAAAKAELSDYRKGFKRYAVLEADKNILPTLETTIPYTDVNSDAASANLSKVAYFVEYVRADNNAHKWVWVDMDAFGTTIGDVGLPVAKHQQVVRHLHVKSNHGAIDDVAADSEGVTGFIEFSPFGYSGASGSDSGPKDYSSRYDWNDTLVDSNTYACMQVHRIISTSAKPGGQVLFAFNNWRDSSTEAEFGIGNFSQHFSRGNQTFDYTDTKAISTMNAAAYSVKRIEIWTKPTSEYQSNDLKGTDSNSPAVATFADGNSEVFTLTIPGEGLVRVDQIVLGLRTDSETEINRLTTRQLAVYSGDTLLAMSDLMNGSGEKDMTTFFANGAAKQTFTFSQDCVLACGTGYTLKLLNASGGNGAWPALLESQAGAEDYSPIVNTTIVSSWRLTQSIYASKVYSATVSADVDAFGSLSFSPSLPTDSADTANSDLLVNVTDDVTLTIGNAMPEVGSIRFSIADGVTLTLADPVNINAGEVVVYGPGTLAFDDSATFKTGTDLEFAGAVKVALASGQVLTTTGDLVVGSGATLTLAPATIAGLSASLVSAASISGEIALTAPDENSDYSLTVSATGVALHRTSQAKFTYNPVPGDNTPTGWITGWGGESFATTSLRVGPSSDIPHVYHVASGKHPWVGLAARTSGFSYAIYADVSHMESDKGVITAFGNENKGLFLYRDGDYVKLAHVVNGSITTLAWVPGVAISAGYHLYTVTFDPTTGAAALYLDDGSVCAATDGSTHAHLGTQGLNNGFQLGSVYEGVGDTGFHVGAGLAVCAVRGYDVVLQPEEVETISQSFPATDGNVTWNVEPDNTDNTVIVTSATFGNSNYIAQSKGTLTIPAGSEVNVNHIRVLNNNNPGDRATVNIAGTLNITSTSTNPNTWADRESNKGVLFGHYHGQGTYNITGSLLAEDTYIETVYTAEAQLFDISGGTVKTKALYANNGNSTVKLRDGGTLEVAEILSTGSAITKEFKYGTFRVMADATETRAINFSAAGGYATTLDPHGNTLTLESAALTGSGDITVADSSDDGDGKVVFVGGSSYTGRLIMTDANAGNIDISGYTGTVLCQGTEATTIAMFDGFAGTVYFTSNIDATALDLSGATVHIADNCTFTAVAGKEGSLVLGSGAVATLNVDDNTVKYEGYVPVVSGSGTVGYYNTGTSEAVSGADYVNGNNLLPYYNVWSASATASENTLSANAAARWKSDDGVSGVLPADNKNVAFKLENGDTVTLLVDATKTFNDIQVFGNGTLIIQQSGDNVLTVGKGLYTTANAGVEINSGLEFASGAELDVECAIPRYVEVNCGTAESPFEIPVVAGSGLLIIGENKGLTTGSLTVGTLTVQGKLALTGAGSATTASVYVGGVVDVSSGTSLTVPTLAVNGTVTMGGNTLSATTVIGTGRVEYTNKLPDTSSWATGTESTGWRGTVAFSYPIQGAVLNSYGNAYSTVALTGVSGSNTYLPDDDITTNVRIEGAVTINNGNPVKIADGWTQSRVVKIASLEVNAALAFVKTGNTSWNNPYKGIYYAEVLKCGTGGSIGIGNQFVLRVDAVDLAEAPSASTCVIPVSLSRGGDNKADGVLYGPNGVAGELIPVTVNGVANGQRLVHATVDETTGLYLAVASVTVNETTTYYPTLAAVKAAVGDNSVTINLLADTSEDVELAYGQALDTGATTYAGEVSGANGASIYVDGTTYKVRYGTIFSVW